MAIDIESEDVMSLTEATRAIPPRNGKRVAVSTLWRWCRKGLGGVRLEYIRVGRNIATSTQALNRFFAALAEQDAQGTSATPQTVRASVNRPRALAPAARRTSLEQADRILQRAGI